MAQLLGHRSEMVEAGGGVFVVMICCERYSVCEGEGVLYCYLHQSVLVSMDEQHGVACFPLSNLALSHPPA